MKSHHTTPRVSTYPISTLFLALTTLTLSAGCAINPNYTKPDIKLPDHYNDHQEQTSQAAVDPTWWTHFNDPILNDLIQKSLDHNADLQASIARIENAEATLREINGAMLPTISAQTSSSRSRVSQSDAVPLPSGVPALRNLQNVSLVTSFELDVFGKLHSATSAARADLLATHYARDSLQLSLTGFVAQQYFALRASDTRHSLLTQARTNREARHTLLKHRYQGGLASELDIRQSEASLALLDAKIAAERQNHALLEHQLGFLTGTPDLALPHGTLSQLPVPPTPPAGLPSQLLESRPDIQQAEASLASMQARVALAKAAYFPTISLTGNLGSESTSISDLFSSAANVWSFGLNTTLAIFDAGRNAAREDEAQAKQHEALALYIKSVQTAFQEVSDALSTLDESTAIAKANTTRTEASQKALKLTDDRYQAGYIGYADVLDAQQNVLDAQQDETNATQARLTATVSLFKTLGGGWHKPITENKSKP